MRIRFNKTQYNAAERLITVILNHKDYVKMIEHKVNNGQRIMPEIEVESVETGTVKTFHSPGESIGGYWYECDGIKLKLIT